MDTWPDWWEWEIELTPHLLKRMIDRQFSESELRQMLDEATNIRENHAEGRFAVQTKHDGRRWEVILEPVIAEKVVLVITAYPLNSSV